MWIYGIGIRLYRCVIGMAAWFHPKARAWVQGRRQFAGRYAAEAAAMHGCVWFHCASLGEFEQGRPIIDLLRKEQPHCKILITFFSPSGYEIRRNYPAADLVTYLPLDTRQNARMFLDLFRPSVAIFVKYEFWHRFLRETAARRIPLYLVSGLFRPGQYFFRPWGGFGRNTLRQFTGFFVQDEASQQLLNSIHISSVSVTGDNRVDRAVQLPEQAPRLPALESFLNGRKALVFGSTWPADEEFILPVLPDTGNQPVILVPHDPSEPNLKRLEQALREPVMRYSALEEASGNWQGRIVLVDRVGLLVSIYRYARLAYIGGGFGRGIHNILEPAAFGLSVIFGPNYRKFREANDLVALNAAVSVTDREGLRQALEHLPPSGSQLPDAENIAIRYLNQHTGGTAKVYQAVFGSKSSAE